MNADIFWSNVKPLIKACGLTQSKLAEACCIPFGTLQGWIAKSVLPDVFSAFKIAQTLGVSVEFIVTGEESRPDIRELQELKTKYEALVMTIKGIASTL